MKSSLSYEILVQGIYESMLRDEVDILHRKKYKGKNTGQHYEIDLSFEFDKAGLSFLVLIECKYYSRKVEIGEALEFAKKIEDISAHKGVIVSTIGFQAGVFRIANAAGIALVKVDYSGGFDIIGSSEGTNWQDDQEDNDVKKTGPTIYTVDYEIDSTGKLWIWSFDRIISQIKTSIKK